MEHIPLPKNKHKDPDVPLLSLEDYDGGPFSTYPERQGWVRRSPEEWNLVFESATPELHAFLQRWLYFGSLEGFLGHKIDVRRDFTRWKHGKPYVTTEKLHAMVDQIVRSRTHLELWAAIAEAGSLHESIRNKRPDGGVISHTVATERRGQDESMNFFIIHRHRRLAFEQDAMISISTSLLLHYLRSTARMIEIQSRGQDLADKMISASHGDDSSRDPCTDPVWELMRNQGWCPSQLAMINHRFSVAGMFYMSFIAKPTSVLPHNAIRVHRTAGEASPSLTPSADMKLCSPYACRERLLADDTYVTKHDHGCSGCPDAVVNKTQLSQILLSNSFPLILVIDAEDREPKIELVPWKEGTRYIAISHVWSDGLGNVIENAIPCCQLRRLSKLVSGLSEPASEIGLFWFDTICVPPDSANEPELQNKAIESMRAVYSESTATLVLDRWLLETSDTGLANIEILMYIFSCEWNRRLWTFQEGVLPNVLFFKFKDTAYDLDALASSFEKEADVYTKMMLGNAILKQYYSLRKVLDHVGSDATKLSLIASGVSHRSTSVASDEAICLATLMGFDMEMIVSVKPEDRMKTFWSMMTAIPMDILKDEGPHHTHFGYRWSPRSLLMNKLRGYPIPTDFTSDIGEVHRTEHGFEIQTVGILVRVGDLPIGGPFWVFDTDFEVWHYVQPAFDVGVETLESYTQTDPDVYNALPETKRITPHQIHGGTEVLLLGLEDYHMSNRVGSEGSSEDLSHRLQIPRAQEITVVSGSTQVAVGSLFVPLGDRDREGIVSGTKVGSALITRPNLADPQVVATVSQVQTALQRACNQLGLDIHNVKNGPVLGDKYRQGNLCITAGRWSPVDARFRMI